MHEWAKSIMDSVKTKADSIGIDNFDNNNVCELEKWAKICKDIAEYDYYYNIVEAMENSEYGVDYDENGRYYTPTDYRRMTSLRDMDRDIGRMYYTEPSSRYEDAKKRYTEVKSHVPANDSEGIAGAEAIANVVMDDVKELLPKMTAPERTMLKQKLISTANML